MIRFICKSTFCLPDGSKSGVSYKTFLAQKELEEWLRDLNSYEDKTLVGCELIDEEK